ncbi:HNH endonuclease signature motif containing protein [Corynebacterium hansenii]|nr:HNH endonuclease signature motif containing protein [Corynebacterium hansenii]
MAFDHVPSEANDDEHNCPDHHRNQHAYPPDNVGRDTPDPVGQPDQADRDGGAGGQQEASPHQSTESEASPRKMWVTERTDDALACLARGRNIAEVDMAIACTPDGGTDVDSHAAAIATRIGAGKVRAMQYCDVGVMLHRMPRIRDFCTGGVVPMGHLVKIAAAIIAVTDDHLPEVETRFLEYLTPRRDFQALPGIRVFARHLARIVEDIEPISTPPDDEEEQPASEGYVADHDAPGDHGCVEVVLRKDRLAEFDATVRAIRDTKLNAGETCTLADALMHLCRGDHGGANVTLNVYADGAVTDEGELRLWLDGAGWLPRYVTKQWLERASSVRLSSDSVTGGYVPTEAQKARVRGRDGGCRFPGCSVPADKCQIDHVVNYDPNLDHAAMVDNPLFNTAGHGHGDHGGCSHDHERADGFVAGNAANGLGATATWNLQCLCQHHHNLKTSRHWHAVMHDDASVTWSDHTGETQATTVPHGPIAHIKRQTFDQRATRLAKTIRANNDKRMRAETQAREAMDQAEVDAALREHARQTAKYERDMAEFVAGPLNSPDPVIAADAQAVVDATDDGWPGLGDDDLDSAPQAPRPLGPDPTVPF